MKHAALVLLLLLCGKAGAESVKDLPKPASYVSDFAGILDAGTKQQMERLCGELDHQANAQVAVVTVHNLDGNSVEDFAADLEQKWGVGRKGTDRGVLMLFALDEHKDRVEVGYGLEGVLNDAKVGDILRNQRPLMQQGQYSQAVQADLRQLAQVIAADAGVTLTEGQHTYHRERARQSRSPLGSILRLLFVLLVLLLIFRRRGGRGGGYGGGGGGFWPGIFIGSMLGGGRRGDSWGGGGGWSGGGGNESGGDGGFGGFGGGSSGGGGASGDW